MKIERDEDEDGAIYDVRDFCAEYDVEGFVSWVRGLAEKRLIIWFGGNAIEFRTMREREMWVRGFESGRRVHADEIGPPDSVPW